MVQVRAPRKFRLFSVARPKFGLWTISTGRLRSPDKGSGLEGGVIPQNDKTCTIDLSQMQNVVSGKVYKIWIKKDDKKTLIGA